MNLNILDIKSKNNEIDPTYYMNSLEDQSPSLREVLEDLDERQKKIIRCYDTTNSKNLDSMITIYKRILKLDDMKDPKRKKREKFKVTKDLKSNLKIMDDSKNPSRNTTFYHCILFALLRLSDIHLKESHIALLRGDKRDIPIRDTFYDKSVFYDELTKDFLEVDKRSSNLLFKNDGMNDYIINTKNLLSEIENLTKEVVITDTHRFDIKSVQDEYNELSNVMKLLVIASRMLHLDLIIVEDKQKPKFKSIITRLKNHVNKLEVHLIEIYIQLKVGKKYSSIIIRSFIMATEVITEDNWKSYYEYLVWLDGNGKLQEEEDMIADWWNE